VITRDLRRAIARAVAAAGYGQGRDPGLRPAGAPGRYAASVALALGAHPRETAATLARLLAREPWIGAAEVTGPGYLTITVTPGALAAVADQVIAAGPACVAGDALAGVAVPAPPPGDPLAAATWEEARAALAARLTARLAAAAGATVAAPQAAERVLVSRPAQTDAGPRQAGRRCGDLACREPDAPGADGAGADGAGADAAEVARAVAFAGRDAVLFTLARAIPGKPLRVKPEIIAKHVPGNPAYAVRYAHARAASGVRWATASSSADTIGVAEACALLDALSWLPERVATAARRGRPDEFARHLEDLASVTVDILSSAGLAGNGRVSRLDRLPSTSDREPGCGTTRVHGLTLARAARTGLAAGLGLLEVGAPERL
jgi:arginyl-tRNA synthetase